MAQAPEPQSAYTKNKEGLPPYPTGDPQTGIVQPDGIPGDQAPPRGVTPLKGLMDKSPPHSQGGGLFLYHCRMFKIGLVQNNPKFLKGKENLAAALELMDKLEADLWVLPELFHSGYNFKTKKEAAKCAEAADGPLAKILQAWTASRGCAVVAGVAEKAGAKLYNSAFFVNGPKLRVYR